MSFNSSNNFSHQWFASKQSSFPFDFASSDIFLKAVKCSNETELSFKRFCETRAGSSLKPFDLGCSKLSNILKKVALEGNISKIAEMDCFMVGLCSYLEMCMHNGDRARQEGALNNFSKQIDCLKGIKRFCSNYKTYESYIPQIQAAVPGVDRQFAQGLPLDSVHRSLNSIIASLHNMNFANYLSPEYSELLNTRETSLKRAKALHAQQQIAFMDRYSADFPIDSQSEIFLNKRDALVKSIDSVLEKTALALSAKVDKSQELNSSKKTKSSPDIER